ncbi:hypothetical protein [uncultured Actinobacillus sp.]|uniref:hypothetical protein n=1 Tax=uncultured Actinobacillus sp. TaxID=417616 RepID=UPI0025EE8C4E|nr:hypothetical protein [uncultured Actinobacillus sp.]
MQYLTRLELAHRWRVSLSTINKYAVVKPHLLPKSVKLAGRYRYALVDVIEFENNQKLNTKGDFYEK